MGNAVDGKWGTGTYGYCAFQTIGTMDFAERGEDVSMMESLACEITCFVSNLYLYGVYASRLNVLPMLRDL